MPKFTTAKIETLAAQVNLVLVVGKKSKTSSKYVLINEDCKTVAAGDTLNPLYDALIKLGAKEEVKPAKVKKEKAVKTDSTSKKSKKVTEKIKSEWSLTDSVQIVKRFDMSLVVDHSNFKCKVLDKNNVCVFSSVSASQCASWVIEYCAA